MSPGQRHDAILFDLDGTLVDTAPDMVEVLIALQGQHDMPAVAYELARSNVSNGAAGLVRLAFPEADEARLSNLYTSYLDLYQQSVCRKSVVFPGVLELLDRLEARGIPWGVVTNKPRRMTEPLLAQLGLQQRYGCAVSGDTLPQRKPDPAPMLLACRMLNVDPARTIYVGDALRDIQAGQAAGMMTVAAAYGYVTDDDDPLTWQADSVAHDTAELAQIIAKAVNLAP